VCLAPYEILVRDSTSRNASSGGVLHCPTIRGILEVNHIAGLRSEGREWGIGGHGQGIISHSNLIYHLKQFAITGTESVSTETSR